METAEQLITKINNNFKLYAIQNDLISMPEKAITYALLIEGVDNFSLETTTNKTHLIVYNKLETSKECRRVELSADEIKNLIKAIRRKNADHMVIYENKIIIEDRFDNILSEITFNQELNYRRALIDFKEFMVVKRLFNQRVIHINDIKSAYLTFRKVEEDEDDLLGMHIDLGFAKCHLYLCPYRDI